MASRPTLLSIQYLRAAAALAVAALHTGWTKTASGHAGVDVFFVISGFVMAYVSRRETVPSEFLRARLLRVVPLYWLVTLFVAVQAQAAPDHVALSLLFWPHTHPYSAGWPVVRQGWTLTYEMLFYGIFAAVLVLPARLRLPALSVVLPALVCIGALALPGWFVAQQYPLLLEFLAGVWLCHAWRRGLVLSPLLCVLALVAGTAAILLAYELPDSTWVRLLVWGIPSALVVAGSLGLEAAGLLPRVPALRLLGDASYSLYLTHVIVFLWLQAWLRPLPALVAVPLAVLACAAVAVAVHRCVERPLHRWLTQRRRLVAPT